MTKTDPMIGRRETMREESVSETKASTELRNGDVVRYEPERTHTREGLAVAERDANGVVRLWDTYWHNDRHEVKTNDFEVLFNLSDVEPVEGWQWETHKPADRFAVTHQHGHLVDYYVRIGSVEDRATMIENARQRLTKAEEDLRYAQSRVASCERALNLLLPDDDA